MKYLYKYQISALLIFLLFTSSCASQAATVLKNRRGMMTYEESVQRFGPPTKCDDAESTTRCWWIKEASTFSPKKTMRLTFEKGVLASWENTGGWWDAGLSSGAWLGQMNSLSK
ncbi:MAG: hypothetical protein OEV28_01270 [Nitrospirota bacterium]|nr:hypothetical protein [Nitrospirota bacterium]